MSIIKHNEKEVELLARLMRAEAESEGELGMLMVGNVGVNRVLADCLDFKKITSIEKMVFQDPGGFSGSNSQLFYSSATTLEKNLAKRVINGEYFHPATNALWFYAPGRNVACKATWYNQANSGKYKNHCFYIPNKGVCKELH